MHNSQVGATLVFDVTAAAEIVLQIAAAEVVTESLTLDSAGRALTAVELPGRQHLVRAPQGRLTVTYAAEVAVTRPEPAEVTELERIIALRPSRYCPSDRMAGFAGTMFGGLPDATTTVRTIRDWVHDHLAYESGSSGPSTDASDTLLDGRGVCRDYAHLMATLCRSLNVPARVAAVYAPGLSPMDFHLVVETALEGRWRVWDPTGLAPRQSLIRIATGRDAADTALATTISGWLTMPELVITAVAGGNLPSDDHSGPVELP